MNNKEKLKKIKSLSSLYTGDPNKLVKFVDDNIVKDNNDYNNKVKKEDIEELNKIKFHEFCKDLDKSETITIEELDDLLKDLE